eukprot:jgi/Astpho2/6801/Aster-07246
MGLDAEFSKAAEDAKKLPENVSNDDKLILYGLYKQATVGDVNTNKPGMFDPKGKDQNTAKQDYITKVAELQEKYA